MRAALLIPCMKLKNPMSRNTGLRSEVSSQSEKCHSEEKHSRPATTGVELSRSVYMLLFPISAANVFSFPGFS